MVCDLSFLMSLLPASRYLIDLTRYGITFDGRKESV